MRRYVKGAEDFTFTCECRTRTASQLTAYGLTRAGIFASRRNAFTSSFKVLEAVPLYRATADLGRFFHVVQWSFARVYLDDGCGVPSFPSRAEKSALLLIG
jgi:hypothetical protein